MPEFIIVYHGAGQPETKEAGEGALEPVDAGFRRGYRQFRHAV